MDLDLLDAPQARRLQAAVERTMAGDTMEERQLINDLVLFQFEQENNMEVETW